MWYEYTIKYKRYVIWSITVNEKCMEFKYWNSVPFKALLPHIWNGL